MRQVKADAQEWTKIQGMLKHVKGEMKTLQQKCDSWEQRALHAESKCATLEIQVWKNQFSVHIEVKVIYGGDLFPELFISILLKENSMTLIISILLLCKPMICLL